MTAYNVLGVSRDATQDEIKKAYRRLVHEHHPDQNGNSPESGERLKAVIAAFAEIGMPEARAATNARLDKEAKEALEALRTAPAVSAAPAPIPFWVALTRDAIAAGFHVHAVHRQAKRTFEARQRAMGRVKVAGYTRADGTEVDDYWRAA